MAFGQLNQHAVATDGKWVTPNAHGRFPISPIEFRRYAIAMESTPDEDMETAPDHWSKHGTPQCPKCGQLMEPFYSRRNLRRLAICVSCFVVEEWRLAVRRS
jgi:hypothetical protein